MTSELEPKKPYHHGELRAAALAAAVLAVETAGPDALTLRSLALQLGVTHKALYRHFADRASLLIAVSSEGFSALALDLENASEPEDFIVRFANFAIARPRLYELMMGRTGRGMFEDPVLAAPARQIIRTSSAVLAPTMSGARARDLVFKVWGLLHGLIMLYQAGLLRANSAEAASQYICDAVSGSHRAIMTAEPGPG